MTSFFFSFFLFLICIPCSPVLFWEGEGRERGGVFREQHVPLFITFEKKGKETKRKWGNEKKKSPFFESNCFLEPEEKGGMGRGESREREGVGGGFDA